MQLKTIETSPELSLTYLDRYVNDGSPSGYTEINKTSFETDPFSPNPDFKLLTIEASERDFEIYGKLKQNIPLDANQFHIHPDMKGHSDLRRCKIFEQNAFSVSPTSSFRTVKLLSEISGDYIKLHYDAVLGRIYRKLNTKRAVAGVEISGIVKENLQNNVLSNFISIFEEPFTKIFKNPVLKDDKDHWGMVWRNAEPFGKRVDKIRYIVPLFSFWSKDRNNSEEEIVGAKLFKKWAENAKTKLIHEILIPILDAYFELLVKLGFQNEYNAQNLLVGFDESWNPVSIINRDLMGIEKDLGLRKGLGLSTTFDSFPYKILSDKDPLYKIRHSFTFDFKVFHYVLDPLLILARDYEIAPREELIEILRERTKYWMLQLPSNFFPKGKWYCHENVLLTEKENREYIEHRHPILRD